MKVHSHIVESLFDCLESIFENSYAADKAVHFYLKKNKKWGSRDRSFFAEACYEILRWWRKLWASLGKEPNWDRKDLWKIFSIYWYFKTGEKLDSFPKKYKTKFASKAEELSISDEIYEYGKQQLLENWDPLLDSLNQEAKVYLRANSLKTTRDRLLDILNSEGIECSESPYHPDAIVLKKRKQVMKTQAFEQGFFELQDLASQKMAPLLEVKAGQRVIDACAGAGGKSLHLAAQMKNKGKLIALDIHQYKLDQLKKRAKRAGVSNLELRCIDNQKVIKRLKGTADALLLDVPCSGLGVLRRKPDSKWRINVSRIKELEDTQREILQNYSSMLKPGGKLLYVTCSVLPSENQDQINQFLSENSRFHKIKEQNIFPDTEDTDGFYYCLLQKE